VHGIAGITIGAGFIPALPPLQGIAGDNVRLLRLLTKTNKTSCCDARAAPFVSSPVPACSEASFDKLAPEKKPPSFLRLASQQGKP
jgi:hypothetical protein